MSSQNISVNMYMYTIMHVFSARLQVFFIPSDVFNLVCISLMHALASEVNCGDYVSVIRKSVLIKWLNFVHFLSYVRPPKKLTILYLNVSI